jgi:hypothetical protein
VTNQNVKTARDAVKAAMDRRLAETETSNIAETIAGLPNVVLFMTPKAKPKRVLFSDHVEAAADVNPNRTVALKLAAAGVAVFPCNDEKRPLCKWRDESTTKESAVRAFWKTFPTAIVGVDLAKAGLFVVDADRHNADKDGVTAWQALLAENDAADDRPPIVATPRNGLHYVYRQPEGGALGNSADKLAPGVDTRGEGGYIVAPGSVRQDGTAWVADTDGPDLGESFKAGTIPVLPAWTAKILNDKPAKADRQEKPRQERQDRPRGNLTDKQLAYAQAALDGAYRDLAALTDGRNNELNNAARHLGSMVDVGALRYGDVELTLIKACQENGEWAKKGAKQCLATIASGLDSHGALPKGWPAEDFEYDRQTGEVFDDAALPEGFIEDDEAELPEPDDLVKGMVPKCGVMFIGGQSQAGKTFIALSLAYSLALQLPFFGRRVKERIGVAILAAEGGGSSYQRRMRAARHGLKIIGRKAPVTYLGAVPDLSDKKEVDKLIPRLRQLDRYYRATHGVRLGAVIIDTVAAAFDLDDEDDNSEAAKTIKLMKAIGDDVGKQFNDDALMIPVHHYGKMSSTGLRGASGWKAGCEAILSVLADIDQLTGVASNRKLALAKSRDGEAGPIAPFDLVFMPLGTDSDGDEFGSMYVEPRMDKVGDPGGATAKQPETLRVFRESFAEIVGFPYRLRGIAGFPGPEVMAVKLEDVKAEFARRWVTGETDKKKRANVIRTQFNRARKAARDSIAFGFETSGDTELVWRVKEDEPKPARKGVVIDTDADGTRWVA